MSDLPEWAERACAMKDAWHMHRDKLADLCMPGVYNRTTRDQLARAMRACIYAMDRAQEGNGVNDGGTG